MRKILITAGLAILSVAIFSVRPMSVEAAAPVIIPSATFMSFTKDSAGKVTAVNVSGGSCGITTSAADSGSVCSYPVVRSSIFRDANNHLLRTAYFQAGDSVSLRVTASSGGNLIKLVDKHVLGARVDGKVSSINDTNKTFTFTIIRRIKEIAQNATFATTVQGTDATTVKQIEVSKSGTRTIRTNKTKAWTDIDDGQTVSLTGFYNSRLQKLDATHIQLPNKTI